MKTVIYQIEDPNGMHARPAGKLATFLKQFASSVRVGYGEKEGDGKRLLSLMALGAGHGAVLHFHIEGADEETAAHAVEDYCRNTWGKGDGK